MRLDWKRPFLFGLIIGLLAFLRSSAPSAQAPQTPDDVIPGQWIVTLVRNADSNNEGSRLAQAHGGKIGHVYTAVLNGFSFHGSDAAAAALARNPMVLSVVPNRAVHASAQTLPAGVRRIDASHPSAIDAHDLGFTGIGVRIAVLDTGIDLDHADLGSQIEASLEKNCMGVGRPDDGNGHGTHVAGTAAAINNTIGVIGVATGATLVPVKVLDDSGSGSWETLICGINHVTANAEFIKVANMSLGGSGSATGCGDGGLHQAICESVAAGVVYTVAAGNGKTDASSSVPAAYPEVITVSAMADYDGEPGGAGGCLFFSGLGQQCDDTFAKFSNRGAIVDVIAPGVQVYSTDKNNTYSNKSGTSMAAPYAAGVVALVRAANPALTSAQVEDFLKASAECPNGEQNVGGGTCAGQGQWTNDPDGIPEPLINALWAAEAAAGTSGNAPPVANDVSANGDEDIVIAWIPSGSDADGDSLTCSIASNPSHGSAAVNVDCSAGTYTPVANYNGADSFTYRVSDGAATADGTVAVTVDLVNDAPAANADSYSATAGVTLNVAAPGVLNNDTDVDGNTLTAVPVTATMNGGLTLNANGSFSYTPNAGFTGTDSFTYTAKDGTLNSSTATVTIAVGAAEPAESMHVEDLTASSINNGSTWTANVTVTVRDNLGNPVGGVTVEGHWNGDAASSAACSSVTDSTGVCTASRGGIAKRVGSVTFRVDTLTGSLIHKSSANVESNIVVSKP